MSQRRAQVLRVHGLQAVAGERQRVQRTVLPQSLAHLHVIRVCVCACFGVHVNPRGTNWYVHSWRANTCAWMA
jgi:hypothetical protein